MTIDTGFASVSTSHFTTSPGSLRSEGRDLPFASKGSFNLGASVGDFRTREARSEGRTFASDTFI